MYALVFGSPISTTLFSLLYPVLYRFPCTLDLLVHHIARNLPVRFNKANAVLPCLPRLDMRLGYNGEPLLIGPGQVRNIAHSDRQNSPSHAYTKCGGHRSTEQNVASARDNASRHSRDEHVYQARHQLLARLDWRREGGDGISEGLLKMESAIHGAIYGILGVAGVAVQKKARIADVDSQSVSGCGPVRRAVHNDLLQRGRGGVLGGDDGASGGGRGF